MAILRGFPPSNTISPTTYIPDIIEIPIKIRNLKPEEKFRQEDGGEYMRLSNQHGRPSAICYKAGKHSSPGNVYCYDGEAEVIWLRSIYRHCGREYPADCCQHCGEKLTTDGLSAEYGDWCANPNCYG